MATPRKTAPAKAAARTLKAVDRTPVALDLDAIEPGEPYAFRFLGDVWTICDLGDLDMEIIGAADTGDLEAIKTAIQYGFMAIDETGERGTEFASHPLSIRKATALFEGWLEHSGLRPGE